MRKIIFTICFSASCFILISCSTTPPIAKLPAESAIYETPTILPHERSEIYHTVAPGETLWRIAKMYDVDIDTIHKINKIRDARDLEIGRKLYIPGAMPRRHIISLYPSRKWKYIIIHHSATETGSSSQINKAHLGKGWQGIGYHFVIDNGTSGKGDGQIETTPRWLKQMDGAHCNANKMNERGIGICLVGNFSREAVTSKQMSSLTYLVNELRRYYNIPQRNILGHGAVKGARTECPGTRFPWKEFWRKL